MIDENRVLDLCKVYSALKTRERRAELDVQAVGEQLDAECKSLQTLLRRKLARAVKGSGAHLARVRVYMMINHGQSSVTCVPMASVDIFVCKGVELELEFRATAQAIDFESSRVKAALPVLLLTSEGQAE